MHSSVPLEGGRTHDVVVVVGISVVRFLSPTRAWCMPGTGSNSERKSRRLAACRYAAEVARSIVHQKGAPFSHQSHVSKTTLPRTSTEFEVHAPVFGSVHRVTGKPTQRSFPAPLGLVALRLPQDTQQINQVGIRQDLHQIHRNEKNEATR